MRVYPAYARTIAAHVVRGNKPICVAVLLSSRWNYFDHVPKVCIKPDEWAIGRYEFKFLAGIHVVAVPGENCSNEQLGELLLELMRVGPRLLWVYDLEGKGIYTEDWPPDWEWVHDLCERRRDWREIKAAESVMADAQRRAVRAWTKEYETIGERRGLDAALQFHLETDVRRPARVRELFSGVSEPAAA